MFVLPVYTSWPLYPMCSRSSVASVSREGGNFGPTREDPEGLGVMNLFALVNFTHLVGVMGFSGPTIRFPYQWSQGLGLSLELTRGGKEGDARFWCLTLASGSRPTVLS